MQPPFLHAPVTVPRPLQMFTPPLHPTHPDPGPTCCRCHPLTLSSCRLPFSMISIFGPRPSLSCPAGVARSRPTQAPKRRPPSLPRYLRAAIATSRLAEYIHRAMDDMLDQCNLISSPLLPPTGSAMRTSFFINSPTLPLTIPNHPHRPWHPLFTKCSRRSDTT